MVNNNVQINKHNVLNLVSTHPPSELYIHTLVCFPPQKSIAVYDNNIAMRRDIEKYVWLKKPGFAQMRGWMNNGVAHGGCGQVLLDSFPTQYRPCGGLDRLSSGAQTLSGSAPVLRWSCLFNQVLLLQNGSDFLQQRNKLCSRHKAGASFPINVPNT